MMSRIVVYLLACLGVAQAAYGADKIDDRELASKSVPTTAAYFNVINLFSYDQPLAVQANAVPGGPDNAQDSFIQFYLNDQGKYVLRP